jgi:hypothetical protein
VRRPKAHHAGAASEARPLAPATAVDGAAGKAGVENGDGACAIPATPARIHTLVKRRKSGLHRCCWCNRRCHIRVSVAVLFSYGWKHKLPLCWECGSNLWRELDAHRVEVQHR